MGHARMRMFRGTLVAAALLATLTSAVAEDYPSRSIRVVVPFSAAGVTDIVTRLVFERVSQALGQQVIVENRVGAGGTLGMDAAGHSPADGYTLLVADPSGSAAANVTLYPRVAFNPERDLAPVALMGVTGAVLVVPSSLPVKTFAEFVAYSKERKAGLSFGSVGAGTPGHLNVELLKRRAGIEGTHVPYRSISQGMTDLITDRLSFWIPPIPTALPHIRSGKLRALAVSADGRSGDLPEVPTFKELGVQNFDVSTTYAVFAPAGTPQPVIDKLYAALKTALAGDDLQARLRAAGVEPRIAAPDVVKAMLSHNVKQWADVIHSVGIVIDNK